MIRRLIILLLIVGCGTEPEDCAGVSGGNSYLDDCGACDVYAINDNTTCEQDCEGVWDGDAVELWEVCYNNYETIILYLLYQLTGEIPPEVGNLTNLTHLSLSNNQLTGEIPFEIGSLTNLTSLNLGDNQLTGEIPVEIGNLTNLTWLNLYENQLTGEIPSEIGNLTNLTTLRLAENQLAGEIPSWIGQLTNLTSLWLGNNQLTGEIPQAVCDLIESNNLNIDYILEGNNLINTCD